MLYKVQIRILNIVKKQKIEKEEGNTRFSFLMGNILSQKQIDFECYKRQETQFDKINQESNLHLMDKHDENLTLNPQLSKIYPIIDDHFMLRKTITQSQEKPYQHVWLKLSMAFNTVLISEFLVSRTIAKKLFSNLYHKSKKSEDKKIWVNRQVWNLAKTMIRYNSIVFGAKVLLDEHYKQILQKNEKYYQSNSLLHYKIGALVGFIAYVSSIPINEFQMIQAMFRNPNNFSGNISGSSTSPLKRFTASCKQLASSQAIKRMLNNFNFISLAGVMLYRTIYFGGYEKIKSKYDHPINEYILAPLGCSALSLIVSPLDQIKYLQLTSHKEKSFAEIVQQKGLSLWNLPGQKIYTSILKQAISMAFFVSGQKLCKHLISMRNSSQ